ncbi:hypothetical protein L6Q96_03480 [Candidatus Binatia bacterium]|nr:hypothetical protein [Candidatus Binatia bacterium]
MAEREASIRTLRGLPVLLVVMAVLGTSVRAQEPTPTEVPTTASRTPTPTHTATASVTPSATEHMPPPMPPTV